MPNVPHVDTLLVRRPQQGVEVLRERISHSYEGEIVGVDTKRLLEFGAHFVQSVKDESDTHARGDGGPVELRDYEERESEAEEEERPEQELRIGKRQHHRVDLVRAADRVAQLCDAR